MDDRETLQMSSVTVTAYSKFGKLLSNTKAGFRSIHEVCPHQRGRGVGPKAGIVREVA